MNTLPKNNIYLFLVALISFAAMPFVQAQDGGSKGGSQIPNSEQIEIIVDELSQELSLSEKQESMVSLLCVALFEEVKDKMKAGKSSRKDMEALKKEFKKEVISILNAEQQELFSTYQVNHLRRGEHGQQPR